ncbi:MAG TPA: hypothetical protein VKV04_07220, partial [Verrucomicrobiae bacterium]|nr:hypothetical protein [Verrucomicrobiae bacterium]
MNHAIGVSGAEVFDDDQVARLVAETHGGAQVGVDGVVGIQQAGATAFVVIGAADESGETDFAAIIGEAVGI